MSIRKSAAIRSALQFNKPISQFLMCPDVVLLLPKRK
jgi:hypothetical protein